MIQNTFLQKQLSVPNIPQITVTAGIIIPDSMHKLKTAGELVVVNSC